jgi:transposase-like protein
MEEKKQRRTRRALTPESKAEAVRLSEAGDRNVVQVAVASILTETALREWKASRPRRRQGAAGGAHTGGAPRRWLDCVAKQAPHDGTTERTFQKQRPPSSRRRASEVRSYRGEGRGLPPIARCAAFSA